MNYKYDIQPDSKCDRFHLIFSPNSLKIVYIDIYTPQFKGDHAKNFAVSGYHSAAPKGQTVKDVKDRVSVYLCIKQTGACYGRLRIRGYRSRKLMLSG